MTTLQSELGIDEYLRKRLMPAEVAIPHLAGIDMYGRSIPAGLVGGDLVEYINFQQRYDVDARVERALKLSTEYLEPPSMAGSHETWSMRMWSGCDSKPGFGTEDKAQYRKAKRSEQLRIAEDLRALHQIAGSAPGRCSGSRHHFGEDCLHQYTIPSMRSCFRNSIVTERQRQTCSKGSICGWLSPLLLETLSAAIRRKLAGERHHALRRDPSQRTFPLRRLRPSASAHILSRNVKGLWKLCKSCIVQFLPLGMTIPEDHPDRNRYLSMAPRAHGMDCIGNVRIPAH